MLVHRELEQMEAKVNSTGATESLGLTILYFGGIFKNVIGKNEG